MYKCSDLGLRSLHLLFCQTIRCVKFFDIYYIPGLQIRMGYWENLFLVLPRKRVVDIIRSISLRHF